MAQYIDKSALVAEIKGYISNYKEIVAKTNRNDSTWVDSVSMIESKIDVLQHLLAFLDTLEVKEVDLDAELEHYKAEQNIKYEEDINMFEFAKHFFELGLKAQKGEEV